MFWAMMVYKNGKRNKALYSVLEYSSSTTEAAPARKESKPKQQPKSSGRSVELISGGNSTDGKPIVSKLPVLD